MRTHRLLALALGIFTLIPALGGSLEGKGTLRIAPSGREVARSYGHPKVSMQGVPVAPGLFPHWTGQYSYQGTTYTHVTVGTDPGLGSATTVIPTVIVPVRFVFADGSTYDASTDLIDGTTAAQSLIESPIFQAEDFVVAGQNVGRTQFADAYLRANSWSSVENQAPDYHVLLGQPDVLPVQTVSVPAGGVFYYHDDVTGIDVPIVESGSPVPEAFIRSLGIPSGTLPIFVTGLVQWYGLGFHGVTLAPDGSVDHTFIVAAYPPTELFGVEHVPNTTVLTHEITEWLADPFISNVSPGWNHEGVSQSECQSAPLSDLLEVSDPLGEVEGAVHVLSIQPARTYYAADSVFIDWFTRQPSRSANGAYSFLGAASGPTSNCLGHLELEGTRTFMYPDSRWTGASGLNDRGDVVGSFLDSEGRTRGFVRINGRMTALDLPGAVQTVAMQINNQQLVVGYGLDQTGMPHGFTYQDGSLTPLDVPGALATEVQGVNADGTIVGYYFDPEFRSHGFVLRNGQFATLDAGTVTELAAISNRGVIAGATNDASYSGYTGFLQAGERLPLSFPYALQTYPTAINDGGDLVGLEYRLGPCPCLANWTGFVAHYANGVVTGHRYVVGWLGGVNRTGQVAGSIGLRAYIANLPKATGPAR